MVIAGIDPGLKGAIAIMGNVLCVVDTPLLEKEYNMNEMADILTSYDIKDMHVFLEKSQAMPGQGVCSMFSFGKGYGIWLGILSALKIPYTLVHPAKWKKEMMEGLKDKDASRLRVCQLFPKYSLMVARKKDVGRADAILIAEYGRRRQHSPKMGLKCHM